MSEPDKRLMKSYVWHDGKCFFVSTIERDSSSMEGGRFSETMVWEFDWENNKRGQLVAEDGGLSGSIHWHIKMCKWLFEGGKIEETES